MNRWLFIEANPQDIIIHKTDWSFVESLKKELNIKLI